MANLGPSDPRPGVPTVWAEPWELRAGARTWMDTAMKNLARAGNPVYAMFRTETVSEMPRPGSEEVVPPEYISDLYRTIEVSHEWTLQLDAALEFDVDSFLAQLLELADAYARQLAVAMLEYIGDVATALGQVVDARGRDPFEVFIEALEKAEFSFNEEGKHEMTVIVHPDLMRKLQEMPRTADQEERLRALLERKRNEWNASRRRRNLPRFNDGA